MTDKSSRISSGATHESPLTHVLKRLVISRSDWLAVGLITLAVIAFFAPVLFGGFWLPNGGGDLVSFLWPTYRFASQTLRSGDLPLWNPHLYSGAPFWADNQSSLLYPPTLLVMLVTDMPYQALEGLVIAHIWLAGLAMFACLRLLLAEPGESTQAQGVSMSPAGAALGAILFMLSDVFVTHIGNLNLIAAAAWLPLTFLGAWHAMRDLSWHWAVFGGVTFGLGILAGHAQMSLFTAMMIGGTGIFWLLFSLAGWRETGRALLLLTAKRIGLVALIALIGLGLSAGGWLPTLEMTQHTARIELTYEAASKYSLPPRALVGVIAPWVYGRGPANFTGTWDRVEVGYVGVIGLALSVAGALVGLRAKKNRALTTFLILVTLVAFLLALGKSFPLHRWAWEFLPGFRSIRAPARFVLLMNFAEAGLGAIAIHQLYRFLSGKTESDIKFSIFNFQFSNSIWLLPVLAAAELIAFGSAAEIDYIDPRVGYNHPEVVAWLSSQPDQPFRVDATPAASWQPDAATMHGGPLYDTYGIPNPLTLAAYHTYYWAVGYRGSPTYNALGVRFVISDSGPPGDESFVPVKAFPDGLTIYQNKNALPMAWLAYRAISVDSQPAAFERVHRPNWNASEVVVVENGPALKVEPPSDGRVRYQNYGVNQMTLEVANSTPAYLMISETYYPGWVAIVDGHPTRIYRANSAFRAVYLDSPGQHIIEMVFRPTLVYVGLGVTLFTSAGLLLTAISWLRRASKLSYL